MCTKNLPEKQVQAKSDLSKQMAETVTKCLGVNIESKDVFESIISRPAPPLSAPFVFSSMLVEKKKATLKASTVLNKAEPSLASSSSSSIKSTKNLSLGPQRKSSSKLSPHAWWPLLWHIDILDMVFFIPRSKAIFTLYRIDFRSDSGIDLIQCEQCLGKSNQTGPVWSWAVHTIWDQSVFWSGKSKPTLESKRAIMRFHSKNGTDPLNRSFTLGAEHSKKLSDRERITFGIRAFQLVIVTGTVSDRWGKCEQKAYPIWFLGRSDNRSGIVWTWPKFPRHFIQCSWWSHEQWLLPYPNFTWLATQTKYTTYWTTLPIWQKQMMTCYTTHWKTVLPILTLT